MGCGDSKFGTGVAIYMPMKTLVLRIAFCGVMALAVTTARPEAQTSRFWETTFNCPDWNQSMGLTDGAVCSAGDGIAGHGDFASTSGNVDSITTAANNPSGGGGKGLRHIRGYGANNGGGGLKISL